MKLGFVLLVVFLMLATIGCGQKEESNGGKPPDGVAEAEHADSTALDSAVLEESPIDTMSSQHDSM